MQIKFVMPHNDPESPKAYSRLYNTRTYRLVIQDICQVAIPQQS